MHAAVKVGLYLSAKKTEYMAINDDEIWGTLGPMLLTVRTSWHAKDKLGIIHHYKYTVITITNMSTNTQKEKSREKIWFHFMTESSNTNWVFNCENNWISEINSMVLVPQRGREEVEVVI